MLCNGVCNGVRNGGLNLRGFVTRKENGNNNSFFLSCQMGLSDGAFFMIKHTPLPNENNPISSPVCPMGVADTLEHAKVSESKYHFVLRNLKSSLRLNSVCSQVVLKLLLIFCLKIIITLMRLAPSPLTTIIHRS